jgi:hypothetical protein
MSAPQRFATVTIGALTMTDNSVTLAAGKPLVLGQDASADNHAITKSQLDTHVATLTSAINTIAGTDNAFDTLAEMKAFVDGVTATGATDLLTAVQAEVTARGLAVTAATTAAAAALAGVDTSIRTLVTGEVESRAAGDKSLNDRLFHHVNLQLSASIYSDAAEPIVMPTSVKAVTIRDGYYFKNGGPSSGVRNSKFNWYFAAPVAADGKATMASLEELDIPLRLINNVSAPFITVYTAKKGTGDDTTWYNTRHTYICDQTIVANKNYLFRALISGASAVGSSLGHVNVDLVRETYSSSTRMFLPTDEILFIAIGSNSAAAAGNVECVIHGLDIHSTNGNIAFHLSNKDVVNKYIGTKLSQLYLSMGQPDPMVGLN